MSRNKTSHRNHPKMLKATQPDVVEGRSKSARLPVQSIAQSRGVTLEEAEKISQSLGRKGNYARVVVLAMDIRASTTFMLHVENFDGYIRIMANFIAYVRHAVAEAGGWFDKFTGDGAHLFWTTGSDSLELKLLSRILDVAVGVQKNFIEVTLPAFRVVAGCIPEGFGLAIGIDYGRCLVSTLAHDSNLRVGGKVLPPETGGSVTVLGRAIVGAVRMVSAAGPHEILLNEGPGEFFHRAWRKVDDENSEFVVNRVLVDNKDLQGKQFAYLLGARPIEDALKRHYNPDDTESPK